MSAVDGRSASEGQRLTSGTVPRFGHGSRVPGWDDLGRPDQGSRRRPRRRNDPRPRRVARPDRQLHGQIPRSALGHDPRAARRAGSPRLVLARGDHAGGRGHAGHPGLSDFGSDVLRHVQDDAQAPQRRLRVHEHLVLAARRRRVPEAMQAAATDDVDVRGFECLGACDIAPMASVNGEYIGPLNADDAPQIIEDLLAGRPGARAQAAALPPLRRPRGGRGRPRLWAAVDATRRGPTPPAWAPRATPSTAPDRRRRSRFRARRRTSEAAV